MRRRLAAIAPLLVLPLLGLVLYGATGHDDTHITYWEAHALGHLGGIVNYDGVPLEQSSTLLYALLLAGLERLTGADLPAIGGLVSLASGVLLVAASRRLARRVDPRLAAPVAWLVAVNPSVVYWSCSGMETTLAAVLLVALAGALLETRLPAAIALVALYLLVRPEAPFVLGGALVALAILAGRPSWPRLAALLGAVAVLAGALALWRQATFGTPFPWPVTAKTGFGKGFIVRGIVYLAVDCPRVTQLLLAGGVIAAARAVPRTPALVALAAAQIAFVIFAGGDWMLAGRFVVALVPLLVVLCARLGRAAIAILVAASLYGLVALAAVSDSAIWRFAGVPALPDHSFFENHHWDHRAFIRSLPAARRAVLDVAARTGRAPVVLSTCAGLGLYDLMSELYGRVTFVDLFAITTPHMARCPVTRDVRRDWLGVRVTYAFYAEHRLEMARDCAIPLADVIWDSYRLPLEPDREAIVEGMGYTIVDRVANEAAAGYGVFVAVRSDLR